MPVIAKFDGIILTMYFRDHNPPHLHARYNDDEAVFSLRGDLLEGNFSVKQRKKVVAYIQSHQEELEAYWQEFSG